MTTLPRKAPPMLLVVSRTTRQQTRGVVLIGFTVYERDVLNNTGASYNNSNKSIKWKELLELNQIGSNQDVLRIERVSKR
eukprot:2911256-Amphidinium_carterae.1